MVEFRISGFRVRARVLLSRGASTGLVEAPPAAV
jgi:hypothetical protein